MVTKENVIDAVQDALDMVDNYKASNRLSIRDKTIWTRLRHDMMNAVDQSCKLER